MNPTPEQMQWANVYSSVIQVSAEVAAVRAILIGMAEDDGADVEKLEV